MFITKSCETTVRHKEANSYFYGMIKAPKISSFMMHLLSSSAQIAAYSKYNCVPECSGKCLLGTVSNWKLVKILPTPARKSRECICYIPIV